MQVSDFHPLRQLHECSFCKWRCYYNATDARTVDFSYKPYCPNCFEKWVASHVPLMKKIEVIDGTGTRIEDKS